jgi:hypothetical protein
MRVGVFGRIFGVGVRRSVYFCKGVFKPFSELARRSGTSVNRLVNLAVENYVGGCDVDSLRAFVEIGRLCREEKFLINVSKTMLRSGSYLPQYADRLFRSSEDSGRRRIMPMGYSRQDRELRKVLDPMEEEVMRRVLARREAVAQRIAELLDKVLPQEKFSLSRRPDEKSLKGGDR